ncbi:hypothetical protein GGF46_003072 [Coemansia sp. RSA 552]|nr:hypothetical protein GGF46_003072 [Coemansia sp. RSA 552]
MYYDLTPQEKERVELAGFFGISVDPVGYGDLAMVIVLSLVLAVGFAATIFTWLNRHYAPLKAKDIPLMSGIYLHSVFFFLGDLSLCGLVHVRGPFFANCTLMLVWFRSMFGNFALGALLTIRTYKFYRVFCRNKPVHGYRRIIPYALFLLFILIVGLISTLVPTRFTVDYMEGVQYCIVNQDLVTTYCAILWCIWAVYMVMVWLLRNIHSSFNEFREMAISLLLLVACTIFNQVLIYTVPLLPTKLHWRLALVCMDQITGNYIWWLIMFKPVVNCLFRHDEYLAEHKMVSDGLRVQYGASDTELTVHSNTLVFTSATIDKSIRTEPSYTESTRQAIDELATYTENCQTPKAPEPIGASEWVAPGQGSPGCNGNLDLYRMEGSPIVQGFGRRRSEPFASSIRTTDEYAIGAAFPRERRSRQQQQQQQQRVLDQRILSHYDSTAPLHVSLGSPNDAIDVGRLEHGNVDERQLFPGNNPLDRHPKEPAVAPSQTGPGQRSDVGFSTQNNTDNDTTGRHLI